MITLSLPLPPRVLHPNGRAHWAVKSKAAKAARQRSGEEARVAVLQLRPAGVPWRAARYRLTYYMARQADGDGLVAWAKSLLDGLQDGGIIENDKGLVLDAPPVQVLDPKRTGRRGVEITVWEDAQC